MAAPGAAQAAGLLNPLNFEGTTFAQNAALGNAYIPPDTIGAIGLNQFLETSNGSLTVYDKTNGAVLRRSSSQAFWSAVSPNLTNSLGDQRVLFDHYTNRWIVVGFGASTSAINIAVSENHDALAAWKGTVFTGFGTGSNPAADYPTLGMDDKAVYIGTNNFNGNIYRGSSLFVIPKTDLFGGSPSVANLTSLLGGSSYGYSFQAAVNWQGNPTNTANVMAATVTDAGPLNRFVISGVNAAGATLGPLQANVVPFFGQDNSAAYQPGLVSGSNRVIDTLDDRLSANIYQVNGKIYGVHTVTPIAGPHTQLQWFVLNASTGALIESGFIADANFDFYQAAIAANQWGEAVISYNRSGPQAPDGNISIMAQAFTTDAGGGLDPYGAALLLKKSPTDSYALGGAPRVRWGDFAAITIDPLNPRKFWAINEYAAASNNWSTYVSALQLADPVPVPGPLPLLGSGAGYLWSRRLRRRLRLR